MLEYLTLTEWFICVYLSFTFLIYFKEMRKYKAGNSIHQNAYWVLIYSVCYLVITVLAVIQVTYERIRDLINIRLDKRAIKRIISRNLYAISENANKKIYLAYDKAFKEEMVRHNRHFLGRPVIGTLGTDPRIFVGFVEDISFVNGLLKFRTEVFSEPEKCYIELDAIQMYTSNVTLEALCKLSGNLIHTHFLGYVVSKVDYNARQPQKNDFEIIFKRLKDKGFYDNFMLTKDAKEVLTKFMKKEST